MIKAVIFDVDDTLVDSNDLHVEAWREALRCYAKELTFDDVHGQMGKGGDQLMPVFCSKEELGRRDATSSGGRGRLPQRLRPARHHEVSPLAVSVAGAAGVQN